MATNTLRNEIASWEPEGRKKDFDFASHLNQISELDGTNQQQEMREGLKNRLSRGYSKREGNLVQQSVRSIFETDGFKKHQAEIGIDFEDPEIFDLSMQGFINTLRAPHGDLSPQATWYYDNIFAKNPQKFLSYLNDFQNSEECKGLLEHQLDSFIRHNEKIQNLLTHMEQQRRQESKTQKSPSHEFRYTNAKEIQELIKQKQKELVAKMKQLGAKSVTATFSPAGPSPKNINNAHDNKNEAAKSIPADFGIQKIQTMMKYYYFIEQNLPDSQPQLFVDSFLGKKNYYVKNPSLRRKPPASRSYLGFSFNYEGKQCVIAESFSGSAAMYLYCGKPGSDFKQMFDASKTYARKNQNIAAVSHFDPNHADEDLDSAYQRAFLFFKTGDKKSVLYEAAGKRTKWEESQKEAFPAWPLGLTNDSSEHSEDIKKYQAWQEQQASRSEEDN